VLTGPVSTTFPEPTVWFYSSRGKTQGWEATLNILKFVEAADAVASAYE
jgi:hypothetical protein